MIASKDQLEEAALRCGVLPFFSNCIPGFSVEEMAAPGMLFGDTRDDYGCWEWKGPVIQEQTLAYGKFFNRKAGFVSLDLLPDFVNYRRNAYPLPQDSTERMILEMVRENEGMSSTDLRRKIFGPPARRKRLKDIATFDEFAEYAKQKRNSIEVELQRLQMGGMLLIADFEYKFTARGERYGWGVAVYSTPEIWFERCFELPGRLPEESFEFLIDSISARNPHVDRDLIAKLIR